jgi:SAM-dependent methyltransferase
MSSDESPLIITDPNPIATDMVRLDGLLREAVAPHLKAPTGEDLRILNLACGRCDEAETLVRFAKNQTGANVHLTGADIRIREIQQARELHSHLPAEFLIEDATTISQHKEIGDDFNLVLLRHQNFWHGPELWKRIFEEGLAKVDENGLIVITSYFDLEHKLALEALQKLGAEIVTNKANADARKLSTPGKFVDKHIAVLRRKR